MLNSRFAPDADYFGHLRMSLLSLAREGARRVLEIGCGHGQSLIYFKQHMNVEFSVGVEIVPQVAMAARSKREIDQVITGDIEELELPFSDGYFDLIVVGHVLEHVKNPWSVLGALRRLLDSKGQLIGSLPNVRSVTVTLPLLLWGRWKYEDSGILDWTHTKFFARSTIEDLLTSAGFHVDQIIPEFAPKFGRVNKLSLGLFSDLLCYTYNFSATPFRNEPRLNGDNR